jgi:hypothetical protein
MFSLYSITHFLFIIRSVFYEVGPSIFVMCYTLQGVAEYNAYKLSQIHIKETTISFSGLL